jgi:hypothetical protein
LDAVLEQDRVHAVLQRAAVLDQVQPEAGPLALRPHRRVGQPDLGDEDAVVERDAARFEKVDVRDDSDADDGDVCLDA